MDIDDLSPDQLASLTGEQITAIEANPDKIEEILNNQEVKDAERDSKATSEQEVDERAANGTDEKQAKEESKEDEEPVLLNKSEKGTIPYSTLQNTRKDLAEQRARNEQLERDLADARAAKEEALSKTTELAKAQEDASTPAEQKEADADMQEHLKVLEEDFPEQYAIVKNMIDRDSVQSKTIESLSARLEKLEGSTPTVDSEKDLQEKLRQESIEAVDNNPDLAHWRDNDPEAFDEADKQDQILRTMDKWKGKSFAERFAEAVKRTRAIMPDASKPQKLSGKDTTDLKAEAKKKVDSARVPEPTTLSDVKGAEGASLSKQEELDNMDELDLTARLMRMSPEEAAAYRAEGDV